MILVKYRNWHLGTPPAPIKLQIPGWAGKDRNHGDGAVPQPWHCPPFVDGSTYGHELIYPFKSESRVTMRHGQLMFEGDFSGEDWNLNEEGKTISGNEPRKKTPPMMSFAPGHYGMSSSLDMEPPEGYILRTEPHPRFFTDETGTVPCLLPGHIQRWWSRIFFVVFKAPREGETHIFRAGEPYGQVLFLPQRNEVQFVPFTEEERLERENRERRINEHGRKIASHSWTADSRLTFDDKYKILGRAYSKGGYIDVDNTISDKISAASTPIKIKTKIPKRLFSARR